MIIKKSAIPVAARGAAGILSVSVRENGQIGFSSKAGDTFTNFTHCAIDWEPTTRVMSFMAANPAKPPKGVAADELIEVKESKKAGDRYMSLAGLFKLPDISYDYKKFGSHTFPATINEKTNTVSFTLPKETNVRVKVTRERKPKTNAAGAGQGGQGGNATPISGNGAGADNPAEVKLEAA